MNNNFNFPKIDLHCHLDGSLSPNFIIKQLSLDLAPSKLMEQISVDINCPSLTEYLKCFDIPIKSLQTYAGIRDGVLDLLENASKENVRYIEIRFAPTFSKNNHLSYNDIFEAAIDGSNLGLKKFGIHSNIIACSMRHLDLDTNMNMIKHARNYLNQGVCAIDLAGDESTYDNRLFSELFQYARSLDFPFTIHAGECKSSLNVKTAIEYGAKRIGHGVAMDQDMNLIRSCQKLNIGIEMCPISNLQTKSVSNWNMYPLKFFLDNEVMATVNTDNRTVSQTNLDKEYIYLLENTNITMEDLIICSKNSIDISFANDSVKHALLQKQSF